MKAVDFVEVLVKECEPEVTGEIGIRALALFMGVLETEWLGRIATMAKLTTAEGLLYEALVVRPKFGVVSEVRFGRIPQIGYAVSEDEKTRPKFGTRPGVGNRLTF